MISLVTGGAGFIGSHLCEQLLAAGHQVLCLDNLSLGSESNIAHLRENTQFQFIKADLLDTSVMHEICTKYAIDTIYHLAANSDIQAGSQTLSIDLEKTLQTTLSCLDCIRTFQIKKLVFASSSAVYGRFPSPMHEESGPCRPVSFYGAAKLAAENFIHAMCEQVNCQAWIIRFPNVVGKRLTHGVIYDFIKKLQKNPTQLEILGDGKQCKPYMLVEDLLEGLFLAQKTLTEKYNVINLGVESATTVSKIADTLVTKMGLDNVTYQYAGGAVGWVGDVPKFEYDLSKMKALGWLPTHSSDQAVERCIEQELEQ